METKEIVINEVNDKTTASTDSIVDIPAITDTSTTTKEIVINEVNDKTTASTDSIVDMPTTTVTSATITEQLETKVEMDFDNSKRRAEKSRLGRIPQLRFHRFCMFFFKFFAFNF